MLQRLAIGALLLIISVAGRAIAADLMRLEHQGLERLVRVENAGESARPTIVMLHYYHRPERFKEALKANLEGIAWEALDAIAPDEGITIAYPASMHGRWGIIDTELTRHPETGEVVDDVGFILKAVARLIADGIADPSRIYLAGISDGAIMSFHLLCAPDHPFAGAAPMIGNITERVAGDCAPPPRPFLIIGGTKDRILPYDGWMHPTNGGLGVYEAFRIFAKANNCKRATAAMLDDTVAADASRIRLIWARECSEAADGAVRLMRVEGGGHTLPNPDMEPSEWTERAGGYNRDLDAAVEIWRFFDGRAALPE